MNLDTIEAKIKKALPDAPSSVHDFYMNVVKQIVPKKESFSQSFDGRGDANYTMVYQSTRLTLLPENEGFEISSNIDSGLIFMEGTDGSIAIDKVRNNLGLPTKTKTMKQRTEDGFERSRAQPNGEIGTRFMSHGISQFQFGNTHDFLINANSESKTKAIPDVSLYGRGFGNELTSRLGREVGLVGINTPDRAPYLATYIEVLLGLDNKIVDRSDKMSPTERNNFLTATGNNTYYTSTFFDPQVLASINGNESDDPKLKDIQASLAYDISNEIRETYKRAISDIFTPVKEKLQASANFYTASKQSDESFEEFAFKNYPTSILNFIITAKGVSPEDTQKIMAHRKLFIDAMAQEANIDLLGELSQDDRSDEMNSFLRKLTAIFDEKKNGDYFINSIMKHIDDGKIPRLLISSKFGTPYINKKDFRQAMQNHEEPLSTALALAKLPSNWMTGTDINGEQIDVRTAHEYTSLRKSDDENILTKNFNAIGYNKIRPYFVRTGQALGRLDDRLAKAAHSHDPENTEAVKLQVNKEKKVIAQQYAWLSKKPDAVDAIINFDEQYNITATLNDYERTMKIFLDALALRAAYDVAGPDGLAVDDEGKMEINCDTVSYKLYDNMIQNENDYRYNLDSDHRDYDDEELFIEKPDLHEFSNLFDTCWSVKSAAENNDKLHKSMSSISKKLGEYSTNNVAWTGLVNEPIDVNGYKFIPITDRKRLLEEGVIQNHCVYTLLNPCLSGETSVFTIEDNEGHVVATMEVHQEESADGFFHENIQLYGAGNSGVDKSIQEAGDAFIDMLDSGNLNVNSLEEENDMRDYVDNDDIEEIADLQLVPFLTDAIYDAYAVIKDHLPMGTTLSDILERTEGMSTLFWESESGQAIQAMERLSSIYELSTDEMLALAKQSPVRLIMDNNNELYRAVHESSYGYEQARIVHQHAGDAEIVATMQQYAADFEDDHNDALWSWIEDNVNDLPKGMDEDSFRRCLRSVIDTENAEKGMQNFANDLMQEAKNHEKQAKRHYELMASYLPQGMSPEPLISSFRAETQQKIHKLDIIKEKTENSYDNIQMLRVS